MSCAHTTSVKVLPTRVMKGIGIEVIKSTTIKIGRVHVHLIEVVIKPTRIDTPIPVLPTIHTSLSASLPAVTRSSVHPGKMVPDCVIKTTIHIPVDDIGAMNIVICVIVIVQARVTGVAKAKEPIRIEQGRQSCNNQSTSRSIIKTCLIIEWCRVPHGT